MSTTTARQPSLPDLPPCDLPTAPLAGDVVMTLLRHRVPLTLLVDLVLPGTPCSAEVMVREEEPGAWVRELAARRGRPCHVADLRGARGDFADGGGRC